MKQGFGLAILGLAATAAGAAAPMPAGVERTTAKAVEPFAQCFTAAQDRAAMPWWFVPKVGGGGTFSNAGANGVRQPYFIDVTDKGAVRQIRLTSADVGVVNAVDRCV